MARYVSTKTASGGTVGGGGASGPTAAEVCQYACKAVCDLFCTNFRTPECRPTLNYLPTAQNCFVVICHCNCWTNCFCNGCFKLDLDTNKYRAFRICFSGLRLCGCVQNTFYTGVVSSNGCFCCCNQTYRYLYACNKWPMACNCCCYLQNYWCCGCVVNWWYRCQTGCDGIGFFDYTLEAAPTDRPYCNCASNWMFSVCWIQQPPGCWVYHFPAQCSRIMAAGYCNQSTSWSKNQKTNNYICAICFCGSNGFMPTLVGGNYGYTCDGDVDLPHPISNWTVWGWPCCFPVNVGVFSGTTCPEPNEAYE